LKNAFKGSATAIDSPSGGDLNTLIVHQEWKEGEEKDDIALL